MEDNKKSKLLLIGGGGGIVLLYLVGILAQVFSKPKVTGWGYVEQKISFNPFICIIKAVSTGQGLSIIGILVAIALLVFVFWKFHKEGEKYEDERNFKKSKQGTYGTAGWMTDMELKNVLDLLPISKTTGTILGIKDGKVVSLPVDSRLNKHTAIYGASGTGKSRCFVRPQILQCVARGESVVVTDPKGEIYADTAEFMKKQGYDVKMFNLVDPQYSDSWNCLAEIIANPDQVELMSQTFCDVIIKNTIGENGKADHFWDNAEMSLLKALCLYVVLDETRSITSKNIGAVYELLTNNDDRKLAAMFDKLPIGHPAIQPWNIYKKAGETVRGNVIIGLGSRIQVFQADIIRRITTYPEIDMEGPAKRKSAYFVIMSDQDSTLDFLSSLFFSFLFIRLVRYADVKGTDGKCDVPVNFILDEFPNIGQIPDFTKKLSTIRSRDLRVAVIFQNIAQLQNRYPLGLWEEIIGNCDTQLFLGCTDQMTAKFISERTGEMTIEVNSQMVQRQSITVVDNIPQYRSSESVGKRYVLTADEVMRLESNKALIIIRGQKILKVDKFDYSKHPGAKNFEHTYIRNYVPQWRASQVNKRFSREDAEETIERIKNNTYAFTNDVKGDIDMPSTTPLNLEKDDDVVEPIIPTTQRRQSVRKVQVPQEQIPKKQQTTDFAALLNSTGAPEEDDDKIVINLDGTQRKQPTQAAKPASSKPSGKLYSKAKSSDDIDF